MVYRVHEDVQGWYLLVNESGNFARQTSLRFFMTKDRQQADDAAEYLNQDVSRSGGLRRGPLWLRSSFGVF